jgi:hypothetical protein
MWHFKIMRQTLLILIIVLYSLTGFSQVGTFSTTKTARLYWLIYNPVKVVYQNIPCEELFIASLKCDITKNGCEYKIYPKELGNIKFTVKRNELIIDSFFIRAYQVPAYEFGPTITEPHGILSTFEIRYSILEDYGYKLSIDSMAIQAYRKDSLLFDKKLLPCIIGDKDVLSLHKGDKYQIYKIKVKRVDPMDNIDYYWDFVDYKGTIN